ncbi:hypothetical protein KM043_012095 [Ampulex compressa]|nr:hypothetical protein KM043_012095 [Ampulex compressa]
MRSQSEGRKGRISRSDKEMLELYLLEHTMDLRGKSRYFGLQRENFNRDFGLDKSRRRKAMARDATYRGFGPANNFGAGVERVVHSGIQSERSTLGFIHSARGAEGARGLRQWPYYIRGLPAAGAPAYLTTLNITIPVGLPY